MYTIWSFNRRLKWGMRRKKDINDRQFHKSYKFNHRFNPKWIISSIWVQKDAQTSHSLEKTKYRHFGSEDECKATESLLSEGASRAQAPQVLECHSTFINIMFQDETINTEFCFILFQFRAWNRNSLVFWTLTWIRNHHLLGPVGISWLDGWF